jgi:anthranilate phosphoribosyltransferase
MSLIPFLHQVTSRRNLNAPEAREAMLVILNGEASTPQVAAFLVALKMKGETAGELTGFARAMRERSQRVEMKLDGVALLDTCGTGGDAASTFNISTVAAFVTAGAGVRVAKHGNRSISSNCGSADLLEALGIPPTGETLRMRDSIEQIGIGFLFAPAMHTAMRHAQPARLELKMRTVFNLLGPLTNPAGATHQLIGAPSPAAAELMANAMAALGTERTFVVHGSDGMDEVTTTGSTSVFEVRGGAVSEHCWTPEDFHVRRANGDELAGGDATHNRVIAEAILAGDPGPARDIVLVNAAAALMAAGAASNPREGMALAAEAIDSGAAAKKLEALREFARGA